MWSLAMIPGKRFVMPRSSRTGTSGPLTGSDLTAEQRGGPYDPPRHVELVLRHLRRRLDLAGNDLLGDRVDRLLPRRQDGAVAGAELAERDARVLEAVDGVTAALELAGLRP